MTKNNIFIISGPSAGVGKSTIVSELLRIFPESKKILNTMTRSPRKDEINMRDNRFVSREYFLRLKAEGRFLETNTCLGKCYGTLKSDFEKVKDEADILFWILDVNGAKNVRGQMEGAKSIFIDIDDLDNLKHRMMERGTDDDEIEERLEQARKEVSHKGEYDYVVVNRHGQIDETVQEISEIVRKNI